MRRCSVIRAWMTGVLALAGAAAIGADLDAVHPTSTMVGIRSEGAPARPPTWQAGLLERIATTDDLHVATYRENHVTLGAPTWTWSVAVDGELYVRAYNGIRSSWYKSAMRERAGQISAAGMKKLVAFEPVQGGINDKIDVAYRVKYAGSRYLDGMLGERASAATMRIRPAE
jgi:hypothetical protein